jgi:HEAT repeat protein
MTLQTSVVALFEAEREARRLHREIAQLAEPLAFRSEVVKHLAAEVAKAFECEQAEGALRLVRIASLLQDIEGDASCDTLVDILDGEWPEARLAAGEALEAKLFDRFKEVAMAIERALARLPEDSIALRELPYLIGEVAEPSSLKLLAKFLAHADSEVVSSAIEAMVEMNDPDAIALLKPLQKDRRRVTLEDDEEGEEVTLGELATEACEQLETGE